MELLADYHYDMPEIGTLRIRVSREVTIEVVVVSHLDESQRFRTDYCSLCQIHRVLPICDVERRRYWCGKCVRTGEPGILLAKEEMKRLSSPRIPSLDWERLFSAVFAGVCVETSNAHPGCSPGPGAVQRRINRYLFASDEIV